MKNAIIDKEIKNLKLGAEMSKIKTTPLSQGQKGCIGIFVLYLMTAIVVGAAYCLSSPIPAKTLMDRVFFGVFGGTAGLVLGLISAIFIGFFFGLFDETVTPEMAEFYGDDIDAVL